MDNLAQKKEAELGISEKKLEIPLSRIVLRSFFFLVLLILGAFFVATFKLQVFENKKYVALAQQNKFINRSIQAIRGVIYDSKGNQLVFNKLSFDLVYRKSEIPDEEKNIIFQGVADILRINLFDLQEKIDDSESSVVLILENLDYQTLVLLETKKEEIKGFSVEKNTTRDYRDGQTYSQLIGYTNRITAEELSKSLEDYSSIDYVGRAGLENQYEEYLRKNPGKLQIERDALGNEISRQIISLPQSGNSLVLWLDSDLQKKSEEVLQGTIDRIKAKSGAIVALDPQSGGVLALVSLPSFDNNLFNKGADVEALKKILNDKSQPLFNRAIAGQFPTGSTIKPLEAAAALEEKLISPYKTINCQGQITVPHRYDPEIIYTYKDWRTHDITDMRKAIAESCNVYFYTIGGGYGNQKGLGPSRIKQYLELFGWGDKTKIDLPGEGTGFIPSPEWKKETRGQSWLDGDTYNLSIGQSDLIITPLQVATAFAAIANGGTLYQPQVVKEIIDEDKNIVESLSPKITRQNFISPENLEIVREGMRWAVTGENSPHASSITLNSLPVTAAAKTGTAQIPTPDHYDNWVTVFAPYDNPQIVITVILEDVANVQVAALPVAKEILEWYFTQDQNLTTQENYGESNN